jgi:hypothetical protein
VKLALAIVGALVVSAACGGEAPAVAPSVPVCEVRFAAPDGFSPLETFEEPYEDRIGLRLGFIDVERREFHVSAGIPGEFGEGLPDAGTIALRDGLVGTLVGRGQVWIVRWSEGDVCDPRVVLGSGFDRDAFGAALADAGLAEASAAEGSADR